MRTVTERPSFQGDVCIRRLAGPPAALKLKKAAAENGRHIVAHSETGHNHVIDSRAAQLLIDETNEFMAYLDVREACELTHLRDYDTHAPLRVEPGFYEIRRQREASPEGWRRAAD